MSFFLSLSLFAPLQSSAQGWQEYGPDSTAWRDVERVRGMWLSSAQMRIAAVTSRGIALCRSDSGWRYPLRNFDGDIVHPGKYYTEIAFLPGQPDSIVVEVDDNCVESCPAIWKMHYPAFSGRYPPFTGMLCWMGHGDLLSAPVPDSMVYLGCCQLFRSADYGSTWTHVAGDLSSPNPDITLLCLDRNDSRAMVAAVVGPLIVKLSRGGDVSDTIFTGKADLYDAICAGDTILLARRAYPDSISSNGIWRSTDDGRTWTLVLKDPFVRALEISQLPDNLMYAATSGGIQSSTDWGITWNIFNDGLPTSLITDLLATPSPDTILVATAGWGILKVWRFAVGVEAHPNIPATIQLYQNYPNPFNPATFVRYQLSAVSDVRLTVYDLLGREVAVLVNERKVAGMYEVVFDRAELASGVYFYVLLARPTDGGHAGGQIKTKTLVILR